MFRIKPKPTIILAVVIIILGCAIGLFAYYWQHNHKQGARYQHEYALCSDLVVASFKYHFDTQKWKTFQHDHPDAATPPQMAYCSQTGDRYVQFRESAQDGQAYLTLQIYEYDPNLGHDTKNHGQYAIVARANQGGWDENCHILSFDYIYHQQRFSFLI